MYHTSSVQKEYMGQDHSMNQLILVISSCTLQLAFNIYNTVLIFILRICSIEVNGTCVLMIAAPRVCQQNYTNKLLMYIMTITYFSVHLGVSHISVLNCNENTYLLYWYVAILTKSNMCCNPVAWHDVQMEPVALMYKWNSAWNGTCLFSWNACEVTECMLELSCLHTPKCCGILDCNLKSCKNY